MDSFANPPGLRRETSETWRQRQPDKGRPCRLLNHPRRKKPVQQQQKNPPLPNPTTPSCNAQEPPRSPPKKKLVCQSCKTFLCRSCLPSSLPRGLNLRLPWRLSTGQDCPEWKACRGRIPLGSRLRNRLNLPRLPPQATPGPICRPSSSTT